MVWNKSDYNVYMVVNGFEEKIDNYLKFENALSKAINLQLTECFETIKIKKHSWTEENEVMIEDLGDKIIYEVNMY